MGKNRNIEYKEFKCTPGQAAIWLLGPGRLREQFISDFRIVAEYFHAVRTGALDEFYNSPEAYRKFCHAEGMLDFLNAYCRDSRYGDAKPALMAGKREGEDLNMCILLDYAEDKGVKRGISQGIETGIKGLIEAYAEIGQPYEATASKVMEKFHLSPPDAEERMKKYWNADI